MFIRPTIREAPTTERDVFAFHIIGEVTADDMSAMADYMNTQFDKHDTVSMLLMFDIYDGAERGASFDWETLKSRVRALGKVRRYAVVGGSDAAKQAVEWSGKMLPVDARSFDAANEDAAWAFLGAQRA
ncbi:STAS/SEC14 domain-containing protein [Maribius pontilimi]|uniref:STAS/SEC14 domain-containing protein n=1 Tax=Palleronia pontilimi TaxID=1964209 RepID=A0A934ID11_9RHOB|nr:STAS/SEC14 domain-containing protein [Palleronia pontilimi]MBJ3762202.1 STAS/SEC14 domain-containing protein [Palleronia pontilimi]